MPYREPARRPTRYLRFCLDVLTKPSQCPTAWDDMNEVPDARGEGCTRVCGRCEREVTDVSLMKGHEAETFLQEHLGEKPPKLTLLRREDGRLQEAECALGLTRRRHRRIVSALVALGIGGLLSLGWVSAMLTAN